MALTRLDIGAWHYITGTANEVLTELATIGMKPAKIADIAANATSAIFCRPGGRSIAARRYSLGSDGHIA
jgi:hypothetical protein